MSAELSHAQRRGRPRSTEADESILRAARHVLAKRGFTGASMDEIARTAGVGKDTLYRRWNSKETLVRHLLQVIAEEHVPAPVEEDPRYALFVFLQEIVQLNTQSDYGAIVAGVVGESARNAELAATFREFWTERRHLAGELVIPILDEAPAPAELERILDHVLGPIYYRLLLTGAPIESEYLWDLVMAIPFTSRI